MLRSPFRCVAAHSPVPVLALLLFAAAASASYLTSPLEATVSLPPVSRKATSIASPSVCLDDVECDSTSYCKSPSATTQSGHCAPRLAPGQICRQTGECRKNTFCRVGVPNRCAHQRKLNDVCNPVQGNACRPGLTCAPPASISCVPAPACDGPVGLCRPLNPGRLNATCRFDRNCDQNAGFYCRNEPGRCARKLAAGERCNLAADNFECVGFCVVGFGPDERGRCARTQRLGGLCTDYKHCTRPFDDSSRKNGIICNQPGGDATIGRCAKPSQLLRTLGSFCDKRRDLCDARRGLSCRWSSRLRRNVCQQRFEDPLGRPCTRGSEFSTCAGTNQNFPTECRATRPVPGDPFASYKRDPSDETFCARQRRIVPAGTSCEDEHVFCESGSVCRIVRGILLVETGRYDRFGAQPAVYCAKELAKGASCTPKDMFRAACANGLRCMGDMCRAAPSEPPAMKNTHAFDGASCARLPCAPGFLCGKSKLCGRASAPVGFGSLCSEKTCKRGLVCRTRWGVYGLYRCRYPQGVGAYCQSDGWCAGKLRCPRVVTAGRESHERRCYDPSTALWIGQKCNPKMEIAGPRCSTVQVRDGPGFGTRPLRCLPSRNGSFACQIDANPFQICDPKKRIVCGDWRFECRGNACMPRMWVK